MAEIFDFGLQKYKLQLNGAFNRDSMFAVVGDTARRLEVQLLDSRGVVTDTTGLSLRLSTVTGKQATYTDAVAADATKGLYRIDLTNGMLLKPGTQEFQWTITDAEGERIHSFPFKAFVGKNLSEGGQQSYNFYLSYDELKDGIKQVENMQKDLVDGAVDSAAIQEHVADRYAALEAEYAPRLTEVTAQLSQTMTQEEFDGWVATLLDGGPSIFYDTLTALEADYPDGAAGVALVRETDPAKIYVWNGDRWQDFGEYQGVELKSKAVNTDKLDDDLWKMLDIEGESLFNNVVQNGNFNSQTGVLEYPEDASRTNTGLIPINNSKHVYSNLGEALSYSSDGKANLLFFDVNKNFITTIRANSALPPTNARYVAQNLSSPTSNPPFYTDLGVYKIWQEPISGKIQTQQREIDTLKNIFSIQPRNLFDGHTVTGNVNSTDGSLNNTNETSRSATGFLEIDPNKRLYSNLVHVVYPRADDEMQSYLFYDQDGSFIGRIRAGDVIDPPENARYVRQNLSSPSFSVDLDSYIIYQDMESGMKVNLETVIKSLVGGGKLADTSAKVVHVHDFHDGWSTDSEVINDCLTFVSNMKEKIIVFDQKDWHIDEAILLPSDTTVIVDGCTIKQNDEVFDNVFRGDNYELDPDDPYGYPLNVEPIANIKILGINGARIVGPDVNRKGVHPTLGEQEMVGDFWGWRTLQICLSKASNFEIAGFEMTQTRCWAMSFDKSSHYKVHDLHIVSEVKNGDGVDNRAGCHDFEIYNITGSTSDDTVAMTAGGYTESSMNYPRENYVYPLEPTRFENLELPKEELAIRDGNVYNINTVGEHHGVICLATDGLQVHDIFINHVHEPSPSERESVVKIYTGYGSGYKAGDLHRIRVNNVKSLGAAHAVQTAATVEDVWFNKAIQQNANGTIANISDSSGVKVTNS